MPLKQQHLNVVAGPCMCKMHVSRVAMVLAMWSGVCCWHG